MSALHPLSVRYAARRERGFTLVELMVTVAIAVFLLFGLVTVVQNVRQANLYQSQLSALQDEQRFAMTILTDVIQAAGYFPNPPPTAWTPTSSLAAWTSPTYGYTFPQGIAFAATSHVNGVADSFGVRYRTDSGDGVLLCDGSTNNTGATQVYVNQFTILPPAGNVPGQLLCFLSSTGKAETLVNGIQSMTIFYGVNRNSPGTNYNVDTYLTSDQMTAADWGNITTVRVQLVFTNPITGAGQPATITFERVIQVMARAGVHT